MNHDAPYVRTELRDRHSPFAERDPRWYAEHGKTAQANHAEALARSAKQRPFFSPGQVLRQSSDRINAHFLVVDIQSWLIYANAGALGEDAPLVNDSDRNTSSVFLVQLSSGRLRRVPRDEQVSSWRLA